MTGGVPAGCPERNQLLSQGEAAHHRGGGEHERLRLPQVQGECWPAPSAGLRETGCFPRCFQKWDHSDNAALLAE